MQNPSILKIISGITAVAVIAAVIYVFSIQKQPPKADNQINNQASSAKIAVVTSFFPLADFAKNVGGELIDIINITPAGAEPHDYEPTPKDIANLYNAKLVILNGNGVDAWGEKIASDLRSKGVKVLIMAENLDSLQASGLDEHGDEDEDEDEHTESEYDPHFWLNPINAAKEADLIAEALIEIDSGSEKEYNQNRENFKKQLFELDLEYKTGLGNCQKHDIVTSHNAFNYMAARYGFSTLYILGISPDEEPSPKALAEVADLARQRDVKYIFFETLVSPKLSETIAREIGAKTLELNPIEGLSEEDIRQGKNYISVMKNNLVNLRIALECN